MSADNVTMNGEKGQSGLKDHGNHDGLAIVGFSFKFPGAEDPDSFWKILMEGQNVMTEIPKDRINVDAFHHPNPDRKDTVRRRT
jgi:acyl transferase domain-containing protein